MAKPDRNTSKPQDPKTNDQSKSDKPTETAPQAPVAGRLRLPLPAAQTHNKAFVQLAPEAKVEAANIALTSKGTNPKRVRVYGYDNLANGGGVPKAAKVQVVAGVTCPKGVNDKQWELLVSLAGNTVEHLYGNKVASRTVRRAYRAGAIRFVA